MVEPRNGLKIIHFRPVGDPTSLCKTMMVSSSSGTFPPRILPPARRRLEVVGLERTCSAGMSSRPRSSPTPAMQRPESSFIRGAYKPAVQHGEPRGVSAADVRRVTGLQVPRRRQVPVHPPAGGAGRLPHDARRTVDGRDGAVEGRRQQHRLFARQHHQTGRGCRPAAKPGTRRNRRSIRSSSGLGDLLQAGLVFLGARLVFAVPTFAAVSMALVGAWLGVVALLNRQLRAKAERAGTRAIVSSCLTRLSPRTAPGMCPLTR